MRRKSAASGSGFCRLTDVSISMIPMTVFPGYVDSQ